MPTPQTTALQNTCVLQTPDPLLNEAFRYAKDNIARCMRYYTLGWGMSNAPHNYAIVVGRDTGWMSIGIDYVVRWFGPAALDAFRQRQKPNGQIVEYIDMETGAWADYGLNIADNTPFYIWAVWHRWHYYHDDEFLNLYLPSIHAAADHLVREVGPHDLLVSVPAGVSVNGITSWRNIIADTVIAGEVTEINALSAMALRMAAELTGNPGYADTAARIAAAVNTQLWQDGAYLLYRRDGVENRQITGDLLFPLLCGVANAEQCRQVLARLSQPDFWSERGLRTVPNSDPGYQPKTGFGLLGGSWPNLTLWYAAAIASHDANRALDVLNMVARPVVEPQPPEMNINQTEFPEFFDGDNNVNLGMRLSPWVAPTFIWAVMEGLLGLSWKHGEPHFSPNWPEQWQEVRIANLPTAAGAINVTLRRDSAPAITPAG